MPKAKLTEEQIAEGFQSMRENMGIESRSLGDTKGSIKRVKCSEAEYFPNPPAFWKASSISIYHLIDKDANDYLRVWEYNGLRVMASAVIYPDGREWLHVSFSRKNRVPDYKDMKMIRDHFFGEERKCIMVFPTKDHYVNIASTCLHFYYSKYNPIPDFDFNLSGFGPSL